MTARTTVTVVYHAPGVAPQITEVRAELLTERPAEAAELSVSSG